ncbi:hypothetical protein HAX54_039431, partial [Datura stramonium]|nr:hypothetical protein [Datura stramonium]
VQVEAENVETLGKKSKIEPVEEKPEQQPATIHIVETSTEADKDKKEQVDLEASEPQKVKEEEVSKVEPKEEALEPAPIAEEKPTEATEKIEQEAAEAVTRNEEVILVDMVEEALKRNLLLKRAQNK